jgi:hypothetical protein
MLNVWIKIPLRTPPHRNDTKNKEPEVAVLEFVNLDCYANSAWLYLSFEPQSIPSTKKEDENPQSCLFPPRGGISKCRTCNLYHRCRLFPAPKGLFCVVLLAHLVYIHRLPNMLFSPFNPLIA